MKVVHFSTTDYGGAFRAAERISASMRAAGLDSQLVVRTKTRQDTECVEYFNSSISRLISKIKNVGNLLLSSGKLVTDIFGTNISQSEYVKDADVVVLHWVNSFVSYGGVRKLSKTGKCIIWVMHDEWIYTEGVHLSYERKLVNMISLKLLGMVNLWLKRKSFASIGITFVAVSNWLCEQAMNSSVLQGEDIRVINNPIDTNLFRPKESVNTRYFDNDDNKKVILFGADKATTDPNKGFVYLVKALKLLEEDDYIAICFGPAPENSKVDLDNIDIIYLGQINNDEKLTDIYNVADVMVVPSMQEAFGYTCCEALACGTPVVGFDTSGLRDQIIHEENGYLAKPCDPEDLARGIRYCIREYDRLSFRARETVISRNSYPAIGHKYFDLVCERTSADTCG